MRGWILPPPKEPTKSSEAFKRERGVGKEATISCPHSYPLFYEPLGLSRGHRFLEVGLGSGYGAAVAQEVVGPEGLVVSVEIDPFTFEFGRRNDRTAK